MRLHQVDFEAVTQGRRLNELDEACQKWGFFELVNHPISEALCLEMLEAMAHFFSLPKERKQACERTELNHWGFYDRELTKNVQDWKELYDVGPERGHCVPQWPTAEASFRSATERFYSASEATALALVGSIAQALGETPDVLLSGFEEHSSYLRLNYYPLCDNPAPASTATGEQQGHLGISHHSDAGAVTILLQDGQPGLQVERGGEWHDISASRGAILVNIGDVVQVWSNDRYVAPVHRVLASQDRLRYSAPFFLNPSFEASYAPVASVTQGEAPLYRAIPWREFREGRARGDYADYGHEVQISDYRIP
ncbi:MAG: isopenicillin N synthase family dioxygenase [Myxococcota bacterium]